MKAALRTILSSRRIEQRGAIIILVAFLMIVFVGLATLAVDVSHLYVVRNELQNAADAGALAGANNLYIDSGLNVNEGANQVALDAATTNKAISTQGTINVDVNWTSTDGNEGDIQRGHWSFGIGSLAKGFYNSASLAPTSLSDASAEELDEDKNFINAIKVVARRDGTPAASFFAKIFGFEDFLLSADAVAYIGFAGTLKPNDVDLPIALCAQSLINESGEYTCSFGRMLNGGSNPSGHNTGGWTNFKQQDQCGTANPGDLRGLLNDCSTGNPQSIVYGIPIGTTAGVLDNIINHQNKANITTCWKDGTATATGAMPNEPWTVTLPVIDCPGNQPGSCNGPKPATVVGSVTVNVVWILEKENDIDADAPYQMADWPNATEQIEIENETTNGKSPGEARWDSFVEHFGLMLPTGDETFDFATVANGGFKKKSIYFLPDCTPHEPGGLTGGENFGTLADIPVLVE